MAEAIKNLFGGAKSAASSVVTNGDDAFADFATAAPPSPVNHGASSVFTAATQTASARQPMFGPSGGLAGRPYTKWYRVWERTTIQDFYGELILLPFFLLMIIINVLGTRANKRRAKQWAAKHVPILENEFASVGFAKGSSGANQNLTSPEKALRQNSVDEYITYATGRANVVCVDIKLSFYRRHNPFTWFGEVALAFFMDSVAPPAERIEATATCWDGKEKMLLPQSTGGGNSAFDGFVWAIVHKDKMKRLRNDRYDLSLTTTRESPKLPDWATIMSESAEISDAMLTPELIKAINETGEDLEALIISDQPIDAPKKLDDLVARKRVFLSMKLNPKNDKTTLFEYFLRLPDQLANSAHFRPEAMRKVRATREEEMRRIRKIDEDEKAEERRLAADKLKKEERDRRLGRLSAEEQRKFLQKEKESEQRKSAKRQQIRA